MAQNFDSSIMAQRVRQNTFSAGFGAACLLIYGFGSLTISGAPSKIATWFDAGDTLSRYTLAVGGVLMALAAFWSYTGRLGALAFDAVVSTVTGAGMILSGVLMFGGAPMGPMLYLLFGTLFVVEGLRNGRDWRVMRSGAVPAQPSAAFDPLFEQRYDEARAQPPGDSLASRLRQRGPEPAAPASPSRTVAEPAKLELPPEPPRIVAPASPAPAPAPLPGRGFLASFADDDDAPRGV